MAGHVHITVQLLAYVYKQPKHDNSPSYIAPGLARSLGGWKGSCVRLGS